MRKIFGKRMATTAAALTLVGGVLTAGVAGADGLAIAAASGATAHVGSCSDGPASESGGCPG